MNLLTAEEVAARLRVGIRTAYKIMHEIPHLEHPLRATEAALCAWINEHMVNPKGAKKAPYRAVKIPDKIPRRKEA